jgi:hypothetical protein
MKVKILVSYSLILSASFVHCSDAPDPLESFPQEEVTQSRKANAEQSESQKCLWFDFDGPADDNICEKACQKYRLSYFTTNEGGGYGPKNDNKSTCCCGIKGEYSLEELVNGFTAAYRNSCCKCFVVGKQTLHCEYCLTGDNEYDSTGSFINLSECLKRKQFIRNEQGFLFCGDYREITSNGFTVKDYRESHRGYSKCSTEKPVTEL